MNYDINIPEIGAEMMLNYLYPELEEHWIVHNEGTFYRNYNNDTLSVSPETNEIFLARDGFLKLLPQGMISPEDELQKGDKREKHKEIEERKKILKDVFVPIDSVIFRRKLKVEREISQLLNDKLSYILKTYFGIDYNQTKNPYVKELSSLLPFIRNRRGDYGLIKNLLESLFECKVNLFIGRYSETDSTLQWLPLIRYELVKEKLDRLGFIEMSEQLLQVRDFISEWFIPAEMKCEILAKDHSESPILGKKLILDYNTKIN